MIRNAFVQYSLVSIASARMRRRQQNMRIPPAMAAYMK
jgi:hypothetical protein